MEDYMADNAIQEDLNLPDMPEGDWMEGSAAAANEEDPAQEQLEEEAPPPMKPAISSNPWRKRPWKLPRPRTTAFPPGPGPHRHRRLYRLRPYVYFQFHRLYLQCRICSSPSPPY